MQAAVYDRIALIGIGLIGSSLARVIRREGLAREIVVSTRSAATLKRAEELGLGDATRPIAAEAVRDADLVIVSVPVGASGAVAAEIAPALKPGAIVTDVGSTKRSVIAQMQPYHAGRMCISFPATRSPAPNIPGRMPASPISSTIAGAS